MTPIPPYTPPAVPGAASVPTIQPITVFDLPIVTTPAHADPTTPLLTSQTIVFAGDGSRHVELGIHFPVLSIGAITNLMSRIVKTSLGFHDGTKFYPAADHEFDNELGTAHGIHGAALVPPYTGVRTFTLAAWHLSGDVDEFTINILGAADPAFEVTPFMSAGFAETVAP